MSACNSLRNAIIVSTMPNASPIRKHLKSLAERAPTPVRGAIRRVLQPGRYVFVSGEPTYNADGLITVHNADFVNDPRFNAAYEAGAATGSWAGLHIEWRTYIACWAADQVKHIEGDFVECGVNRGGLSRAVCEYVDMATSGRSFYLLDTFNGVAEEYLTDAEKRLGFNQSMNGYYDECFDDVVQTFASFPNVKIVRGPVPETLSQVTTDKVAYLSIDMNCVEPEIAAAEYFWDRIPSGGIVVLDDYAFVRHSLQKAAFDKFATRHDVQVLSLPTGQGLIFRP